MLSYKLKCNRPVVLVLFTGISKGKGKGKVHPRTGHEGPERGYRYSCTLFLTSARDGGGWSTPCSGHLTLRKERWYPFFKRLGGPQSGSGCVRKILPPPEFDSWITQPVASRYTYYAILAWYCLLNELSLWWLYDTLQVTRWYMYPDKQWWQYVTDFWFATRPALPGVLAERQDVTWTAACPACNRGWTGVRLLLVPTNVFMEPIVLLVSLPHIILSWW